MTRHPGPLATIAIIALLIACWLVVGAVLAVLRLPWTMVEWRRRKGMGDG